MKLSPANDGGGENRWWFDTLGEDEKARTVPVSGELLQELHRYPLARGLSPLPDRTDETPLVLPFRGPPRGPAALGPA